MVLALTQVAVVLFATARILFAIEKRQEGKADSAFDRRDLVQQRAGKCDCGAGRSAIGAIAEFGKAKIAALILLGIEIDRERKTPMGRSFRNIVPMRAEIATGRSVVAGDDIAV